jgi:hypothetical protein
LLQGLKAVSDLEIRIPFGFRDSDFGFPGCGDSRVKRLCEQKSLRGDNHARLALSLNREIDAGIYLHFGTFCVIIKCRRWLTFGTPQASIPIFSFGG